MAKKTPKKRRLPIAARAAKKKYSPHVPLDIEGEREKAQKLVQKVEEKIGGRRGKGIGKVMLGPLPKTEARPEPQWAEESIKQPQAEPAPIVGMVRVEEGKAQFPPVAEAGAPRVKGPVLRNSFLFAVFGGGLVGLLMHLAKLDSGFIASAALLLSLLVFAISYFYLNYSSR